MLPRCPMKPPATIAHRLHSAVTRPASRSLRQCPEAHDAYLRGRYFWFATTSEAVASTTSEKAIELQPDYAAGLEQDFRLITAEARLSGRSRPRKAFANDGRGAMQGHATRRLASRRTRMRSRRHYLFVHWDWMRADQGNISVPLSWTPRTLKPMHSAPGFMQVPEPPPGGIRVQKRATRTRSVSNDPWRSLDSYHLRASI